MHANRHDAGMQGLHFLQARGGELPLWRRTLVDPNADKNLAKQGKNAGNVVETRDNCSLARWLREVSARRDAEDINISEDYKRQRKMC